MLWKMRWRVQRDAPAGAPAPPDDPRLLEADLRGSLPIQERDGEVTDGMEAACRELYETRLNVEVDDHLQVPMILHDQNAGAILEVTQRLRECRERERSSVPPVYNFGGDSSWSGGDP